MAALSGLDQMPSRDYFRAPGIPGDGDKGQGRDWPPPSFFQLMKQKPSLPEWFDLSPLYLQLECKKCQEPLCFIWFLSSQASPPAPQERDDGRKHAKQKSEISGTGNAILILLMSSFFWFSTRPSFPPATYTRHLKIGRRILDQIEGSF